MRVPDRKRLSAVGRSAVRERWLARAPRIAFWVVVAVLTLAGLKQIIAPATEAAPTEQGSGRVDPAAEELAQRFARAYLTYDAARPGPRERDLAALLSGDFEPGAGFTPLRGAQRVLATHVAQHQEALAGGVVIVVAAELGGEAAPIYLGVPIDRRADGALAITGYPSIVGPPTVARGSSPLRESVEDRSIEVVVARALANYLASNRRNLAADLAAGAEVSPPLQRLRLITVDELVWARGPELGAVLATIRARAAGGSLLTLTYEVGIERAKGDDRTTVTFIETVPSES